MVTFYDARATIRTMMGALYAAASEISEKPGDVVIDAIASGNKFLRDAGHNEYTEQDWLNQRTDDEDDVNDSSKSIFVSITDTEHRIGVTVGDLVKAAIELMARHGFATCDFTLNPPDQMKVYVWEVENGSVIGNLAVGVAVDGRPFPHRGWVLLGDGVRIEALLAPTIS